MISRNIKRRNQRGGDGMQINGYTPRKFTNFPAYFNKNHMARFGAKIHSGDLLMGTCWNLTWG